MLEINRLYRIIGRCEGKIRRLEAPVETEAAQPAKAEGEVIFGQPLEKLRSIPKETRMLYGGIGIGVLVALLIVLRLVKRGA